MAGEFQLHVKGAELVIRPQSVGREHRYDIDSKAKRKAIDLTPMDGVRKGKNTRIKAGDECPAFECVALDGQRFELSELQDKAIVIYFFDVSDVLDLENTEGLWQLLKSQGLLVLAVGRGLSSGELMQIKKNLELTIPLVADPKGAVYSKFARTGCSRTYLVGPDGLVAYQSRGTDRRMRQAIRNLAAGQRLEGDLTETIVAAIREQDLLRLIEAIEQESKNNSAPD